MQNAIPEQIPALLTLAGDAADGAGTYGAAIPLLQNTKANINADITPLVDAIMAYGTGKAELSTRRATANTVLDNSRLFLVLSRDNLKPVFGYEYNQSWDVTGLVGSLAILRADDVVLPLLSSFKGFFTANPAYEVLAKGITAAHAGDLFTELQAARSAVNEQETVVGNLMNDREAKATNLRKRIRGLINELDQRIDPLDQRWKAFGLNMPGAQETPDQVEHVQATLLGPTAAAVKWPGTARASYFRVWKKVVGVDEEPVAVGSPADLDFTLEGLPTNSTVEIYVSALNDGGESPLSEKITIVTHS